MPTGGTETPVTKTIADVFQSRNLWAWFSSTVTNYFDGQSEKGQDYSTSFGAPVGVPVGGKIVRIVHNNNAINDVVEMQDSTGAVWLYQHINATCKLGQTLGCGGIVGTENGLPVDQYSTGPHIEVRYCPRGWSITVDSWDEPWVNPKNIFSGLASQAAGSVDTGANSVVSAITGLAQSVHITPDASVAVLLNSIDVALELRNPFTVSINTQQDFQVLGINTGIPDPTASVGATFEGIEQVFNNLLNDASALVVRSVFLLIGMIILWAVVQRTMMQQVNQLLEPVGGVQGAVKIAGAIA